MRSISTVLIVVFLFFMICKSPSQSHPTIHPFYHDRNEAIDSASGYQTTLSEIKNIEIEECILGALNFLKNKQVTKDHYKVNHYDFKTASNSSFNMLGVCRSFLGNYIIREKHMENTWPSFVSFLPGKSISQFQPFYVASDYNLFTTASTAYPLFLFDDKKLPPDSQFITEMRVNAVQGIEKFKRGSSYNFWTSKKSKGLKYTYSAPDNIPIWIITIRKRLNDATGLLGLGNIRESDIITNWIDTIYNRDINKSGNIAMFNIPNDSDDSSLAMLIKYLSLKNDHTISSTDDFGTINSFVRFRDINRSKRDRYNLDFSQNTGAFLTWHKNDSIEDFSIPENGIIPLKVNNIDITVNSNVLHFLSIAGLTDIPGFMETSLFIATVIKEKKWHNTSLYYPEKLWFPYCLSKAIRDGGLNVPQINELLPEFVSQIIEMQQDFESKHPSLKGAFPVFDSISYNLSTALGLNTLLNLGRENAVKSGNQELFDEIIKNSLDFLLKSKKEHVAAKKYFCRKEIFWISGPLFSSSVQDLAHWFSNSQNTALVLEAFTKYLLDYHKITSGNKMKIGKMSADFVLIY